MKKKFQRWTAKRKVELILHLLKGEMQLTEACKRFDLEAPVIEAWMETFIRSGEQGLKSKKTRVGTEHSDVAEHDSYRLRKQPRRRSSKQIVRSIQDACIQILEKEGPDALSTNRIAKVAGVSIGSLYQYFPNKEAIVAALYQDELEKDLEADRIEEIRAKVKEISALSLAATLRYFVDLAAERQLRLLGIDPNYYTQHHREYDYISHMLERYRERLPMEKWLQQILELHKGRVRRDNLELTTFVATRALIGTVTAAMEERPELLRTDILKDELINLVLRYLNSVEANEASTQ